MPEKVMLHGGIQSNHALLLLRCGTPVWWLCTAPKLQYIYCTITLRVNIIIWRCLLCCVQQVQARPAPWWRQQHRSVCCRWRLCQPAVQHDFCTPVRTASCMTYVHCAYRGQVSNEPAHTHGGLANCIGGCDNPCAVPSKVCKTCISDNCPSCSLMDAD